MKRVLFSITILLCFWVSNGVSAVSPRFYILRHLTENNTSLREARVFSHVSLKELSSGKILKFRELFTLRFEAGAPVFMSQYFPAEGEKGSNRAFLVKIWDGAQNTGQIWTPAQPIPSVISELGLGPVLQFPKNYENLKQKFLEYGFPILEESELVIDPKFLARLSQNEARDTSSPELDSQAGTEKSTEAPTLPQSPFYKREPFELSRISNLVGISIPSDNGDRTFIVNHKNLLPLRFYSKNGMNGVSEFQLSFFDYATYAGEFNYANRVILEVPSKYAVKIILDKIDLKPVFKSDRPHLLPANTKLPISYNGFTQDEVLLISRLLGVLH